MSVDGSRSIVLTLHPVSDLDDQVGDWLDQEGLEAVYSSAILASPLRDNGQTEQVLAIDGLDSVMIDRMVSELRIDLLGQLFRSHR